MTLTHTHTFHLHETNKAFESVHNPKHLKMYIKAVLIGNDGVVGDIVVTSFKLCQK